MAKLVNINDIDEFREVGSVYPRAINETILRNTKQLHEESELEPSLRALICDPSETPHGPTEIADILTTHVHVKGEKRLAAFVLKGKSRQKVSSRHITHQFLKLRQVPQLGLMVFVAVGDIQDDAQRDFIQTACDADCDYLIIDAQDLARLLIAYYRTCPCDGTIYDGTGVCREGHALDDGLPLEMPVRESPESEIVRIKDNSHFRAKRYSAIVRLDKHYPKDVIRSIVEEVTEEIKHRRYNRDERLRERWGETPAHVVWLFLAYDLEDIANSNWVCRTSWIDPELPESVRPLGVSGQERVGDIEIRWEVHYESQKRFLKNLSGTKEEVLGTILPTLKEMVELAQMAIKQFEKYRTGGISEGDLIERIQEMQPRVRELYDKVENGLLPPQDCRDFVQACRETFAAIDDMFLYYSACGLKTWPQSNRDWLMQDAIKRFRQGYQRAEFEREKIH
jgi:hypothetical protein